MNSEAQSQQLARYLTTLPPRHVRKLALTLEHQRSLGKKGFPHEAILNILRPTLAAMRMPRIMTPQRVLCAPFEDLLRPDDPEVKQIGLVSRATIAEMWSMLQELAPAPIQEICQAFTEAQKDGDHAVMDEVSRRLWRTAAETLEGPLQEAANDAEAYKDFTKRVGGSRRAEDLREIQAVLAIAEQVEHVKALLPRRPIRLLSDDHITLISRVYEELAAEKQGREVFLLMVVLGRLEHKFELMKIIRNFSPKMDDVLATTTELRVAGDLVIDALEQDAEAIRNAAGEAHDEDGFMKLVRRYAANFKGITSEIGIRREGEWGQRMFASRGKVSEAIEQSLLAAAPGKTLSVLPTTSGPKGVTVTAPDFQNAIDDKTYLVAERRARAVAEIVRMAEQLGVSNTATQTVESLKRELSRYGAMLIEHLSKAAPTEIDNARNHLFATVLLMELVVNSDEADLLRRRGIDGMSRIKQPPERDDGLQAAIMSGSALETLRPDPAG